MVATTYEVYPLEPTYPNNYTTGTSSEIQLVMKSLLCEFETTMSGYPLFTSTRELLQNDDYVENFGASIKSLTIVSSLSSTK